MTERGVQASAVVVAGGASRRFGGRIPKQFELVAGMPLLAHTVRAFQACAAVRELVVVLPEEAIEMGRSLLASYLDVESIRTVPGGATRQDSTFQGLAALQVDPDSLVVVHDGARPLVDSELIERVVVAAFEVGAAIAAVPVVDTLKEVGPERTVQKTVERERFCRAQTPQCFRLDILRDAYERARRDGFTGTDEASLVERTGATIRIVDGSERNLKVTTRDDLARVAYYLGGDGS